MTNRELAADYAAKAAKQVADAEKMRVPGVAGSAKASCASANATLAVFYQREADREA